MLVYLFNSVIVFEILNNLCLNIFLNIGGYDRVRRYFVLVVRVVVRFFKLFFDVVVIENVFVFWKLKWSFVDFFGICYFKVIVVNDIGC